MLPQRSTLRFLLWPILCGILAAVIILQRYPEKFGLNGDTDAANSLLNGTAVSYANAVQRATPSVVNIYTQTLVNQENHPLLSDPSLRRFLEGRNYQAQQRLQQSLGSGVIVDNRGYVLTNNHVIAGADQILVSLYDQRESLAEIVGTDPETDLAVLRIDLDNIQAIRFGRPESIRVGDVVLAIGNPFGFGQTVTQGIISATGRYGLQLNTYENYLQTDADINPGNSGGPLINVHGELLGINSAIYSRSGGSQGIGLAIPIDSAADVLENIIRHGRVIRGWLGIESRELLPDMARQLGLTTLQGVIISGVYQESPAASAGLQPGDVITHINGKALPDGRTGLLRVSRLLPGEQASLNIQRDGQALSVTIIVGSRPAPPTPSDQQTPNR
jgi:serine protease DegS